MNSKFVHRNFQNELKQVPTGLQEPKLIFDLDSDPCLEYLSQNRLGRSNNSEIKTKKNKGKKLTDEEQLRLGMHRGQIKLAIAELHFLAEHLEQADEPAVVVYVGAAPTCKAMLHVLLFPNVKFLMIDPANFDIRVTEKNNHLHGFEEITYWSSIAAPRGRYFDPISNEEKIGKMPNSLKSDALLVKENYGKYIDHFYNSDNKIFLNQQYLTIESADFLKELLESRVNYSKYKDAKTIFWSDIRSRTGNNVTNENILDDNILCMLVMNKIKPQYSMIKFRAFYGNKIKEMPNMASVGLFGKTFGINPIQSTENGKILFYKGIIHNQCWRSSSSTETRLWLTLDNILAGPVEYDNTKHEEVNFYYNMVSRIAGMYQSYAPELYYGHCADCSIESYVWKLCENKFGIDAEKYCSFLDVILPHHALIDENDNYGHTCNH